MKMLKNMMWMGTGAFVGVMASKYAPDIKKMMKKGKKEMANTIDQISYKMEND